MYLLTGLFCTGIYIMKLSGCVRSTETSGIIDGGDASPGCLCLSVSLRILGIIAEKQNAMLQSLK